MLALRCDINQVDELLKSYIRVAYSAARVYEVQCSQRTYTAGMGCPAGCPGSWPGCREDPKQALIRPAPSSLTWRASNRGSQLLHEKALEMLSVRAAALRVHYAVTVHIQQPSSGMLCTHIGLSSENMCEGHTSHRARLH